MDGAARRRRPGRRRGVHRLARARGARRRVPAALRARAALPGRPHQRARRGRAPARAGHRGRLGRGRRRGAQHRAARPAADDARAARRVDGAPLRRPAARPRRGARGDLHDPHRAPRRDRRSGRPPPGAATRSAMLSRDVEWTDVVEILVRPPMVPHGLARRRSAPRPRGRVDRRGLAERPGLPRAARVRPGRRPAAHPLAVVGQGDGRRRREPAARAAVPRHAAQPRHRSSSTTTPACGPTRRTSRPRCRWPRRSSCAPTSTSSTRRSSAATQGLLGRRPATWRSTRSAGPTSARWAWSPRPTGPPSSRPTPACCSSSAAAAADFDELPARGRGVPAGGTPLRRSSSTRRSPSRVTETGGLVVIQVADKADLAALLRWTRDEVSGDEVPAPAHPEPGPLCRPRRSVRAGPHRHGPGRSRVDVHRAGFWWSA